MKKAILILFILSIFGSRSTTAIAADNSNSASLDHFRLNNTYINSQFSDVNEAAWYGARQQAVIKKAFELSIINGMGNGTFCPDSNLKLSEAIKMAAVIHSVYNGDNVSFVVASKPWYQGYIDYAIANGIISADAFNDYNAYATRAQMAYIFANTLPAAELQQANTINSIPDVTNRTSNSNFIYLLYRSGVLSGDAGRF